MLEQIVPIEQMLVGGEKFWMGGVGIGAGGGDREWSVDVEGDRGEADLVVAGLVVEFQGDVLGAEGSVGLSGEREAEDDFILVHV
jgi:hypothetical protein